MALRCRPTLPSLALLLLFWALSLPALERFPAVGEDEPWIAATPFYFVTEGVWGSRLFTGYYGMERHDFHHPPLYLLAQAGTFRLAGVGVWQMRFPSVALGLLVLPLAHAVGRQVGGARVGLLAMALLVSLRFTLAPMASGVPLLDLARVARYDVAVAPLVLAALWAFNRAERTGARLAYALSGLCAGLAGLCHLYGLFALGGAVVVMGVRRRLRLAALGWLLAGALLPWLPWMAYLATDPADALAQQRAVDERLDLLDPTFYRDNLSRENLRYRAVALWDERRIPDLPRPGGWLVLLGLPVALTAAVWRDPRRPRLALAVWLVVYVALFALLLSNKHFNYLIALWPLATTLLAWGLGTLWARAPRPLRGLLGVWLLLVALESGARLVHRAGIIGATTPYDAFAVRVAAHVPPGARVLGLQHYWLGLRHAPYRTWLLPLFLSDSRYHHAPRPLETALDQVDPDVVLLDRYMLDLLARARDPAHPNAATRTAIVRWMEQRGARLEGVVTDPTYGRMEIWGVGEGP